jgi:hypothetical protein
MKRTLIRRWEYKGNFYNFTFEYWPYLPATRTQPEEAAEINILKIGSDSVKIEFVEGEYENVCNFLLDQLGKEDAELEEAMSTIAVEPWD